MKWLKRILPVLLITAALIVIINLYNGMAPEEPRQHAAALCCVETGELLYSENADERIAPASLTKLLTAATALKYISCDEIFTAGTELELVPPGSSVCLISKGQRLTLYDLTAGMLMASGNDAAYTTAVSAARLLNGEQMNDRSAVNSFCGLMNDLAQELGMNGSRFATPDGSDNSGQYTTVRDLLTLAEYALSVPEIREIASTHQKYFVFESGENITWTNTNRLIDPASRFYSKDAIGLKTGTTAKAGCCLIAVFEKDGKTYIAIAANCGSDDERYETVLKIFKEYAGPQ